MEAIESNTAVVDKPSPPTEEEVRQSLRHCFLKSFEDVLRDVGIAIQHYDEIRDITRPMIEDTQVKLAPLEGAEEARFIEANIMETKGGALWILGQGPLDGSEPGKISTLEPFWTMIDQKEVAAISQLCKFQNNDADGCARYYPEEVGKEMECGVYKVKTIEKVNIDGRFKVDKEHISVLRVQYTYQDTSKTVDILRHFNWEAGVPPESALPSIAIVDWLDSYENKNVLVHCSDGRRRTMMLAAVKALTTMETFEIEDVEKVYEGIVDIRYGCLENGIEQFFYGLVVEEFKLKRDKPVDEFRTELPKIEALYLMARRGAWTSGSPLTDAQTDEIVKHSKRRLVEWKAKKRAREEGRAYVQVDHERTIDHNAFLLDNGVTWTVAEGPRSGKLSTLESFWKLIDEKEAAAVAQLCKFEDKDPADGCARYYPEKVGDEMQCGEYTVTTIAEVNTDGRFKADKAHISVLRVQYTYQDKAKSVNILRHFNWEEDTPPLSRLVPIEIAKWLDSYEKKNVLVHCSDGRRRTMILAGAKMAMEQPATDDPEQWKKVMYIATLIRKGANESAMEILYFRTIWQDVQIRKKKPKDFQQELYYFEALYLNFRSGRFTTSSEIDNEKKQRINNYILKKQAAWQAKKKAKTGAKEKHSNLMSFLKQ